MQTESQAHDCGHCWIIAVDGQPTDIRAESGLATRQAKIRKADKPGSVVEIHYGPASARTWHNGRALQVDIFASIGARTIMATVKE